MSCSRCKRSLPPCGTSTLCRRCLARTQTQDTTQLSTHSSVAPSSLLSPSVPLSDTPAPVQMEAACNSENVSVRAQGASLTKLVSSEHRLPGHRDQQLEGGRKAKDGSKDQTSERSRPQSKEVSSAPSRNETKRAARERKRRSSNPVSSLEPSNVKRPRESEPHSSHKTEPLHPSQASSSLLTSQAASSPRIASAPASSASTAATVTEPEVVRCPDCEAPFQSAVLKVVHQMQSSSPLTHDSDCAHSKSNAPSAPPHSELESSRHAPRHFAPKHGVRLIATSLDLKIVLPLLLTERIVSLDLEGDLTPSESCCIDMIQVYLPTTDLVLLIHAPSIASAQLTSALKGWFESSSHIKVICDVRADADALQYTYGIRLTGVFDLQLAHAMLTGALRTVSVQPADSTFFFPTSLSQLTLEYCGEQVGEPLTELKTSFSAIFAAGGSPFRSLPLSAAAATYAASDAWNVWLVHSAIRPRLEKRGLASLIVPASEVRACEFRDDRNGRARWLERRAKTKADQRAMRVQKGRERAAPSTKTRVEIADACVPSNQPPPTERAHNEQPTRPSKPRIVSGPMCTECGVRFSGQLQLDEHRRGRAHEFVASVVKQESLVGLRVSAESLVDLEKVRIEFSKYGQIQQLHSVPPEKLKITPAPKFVALVQFGSNAEVGRVLGQKNLYVNGTRLRTATISQEDKQQLLR